MATTKTTNKTKATSPAATKRAMSSNGSKPASAKKTATTKVAIGRKKPEEMTLEELTLFVWDTAYKSRHRRLDS